MDRTYQLQHNANNSKQDKVREVIKEYRSTAQSIANKQWRHFYESKTGFDKNLNIKDIQSRLSERYKQTCQYQVVGILDSFTSNRANEFRSIVINSLLPEDTKKALFYINNRGLWLKCPYDKAVIWDRKTKKILEEVPITENIKFLAKKIFKHILSRHRKPSFRYINMSLDSKVALISEKQPDMADHFDYWIRLSTLEKGCPIMLPVMSNPYYENIRGSRKNFCQINLTENNEITISFIKDVPVSEYTPTTSRVSLDLGLVVLFASDKGDLFGRQFYEVIQKYDALISRLTANRQRQKLPIRNKKYKKLVCNLREYMKNEINRVINRVIELYKPAEIVVERLNFQRSNLSRRMNRLLSWFGKSYVTKKLDAVHEEYGIIITYANPAYSSQECNECGYVDKNNRKTQSEFECKVCKTNIHADVNGARIHRSRSSDTVIDIYKSKDAVLRILTGRFLLDAERIPSLYSKAKDLLPVNPYFTSLLAQSKGFL